MTFNRTGFLSHGKHEGHAFFGPARFTSSTAQSIPEGKEIVTRLPLVNIGPREDHPTTESLQSCTKDVNLARAGSDSARNNLGEWQIVNAAPLIPRANSCCASGEAEWLQPQSPSNWITKVNIGKLNTVNAGSNPASPTNLRAVPVLDEATTSNLSRKSNEVVERERATSLLALIPTMRGSCPPLGAFRLSRRHALLTNNQRKDNHEHRRN